MSLHVTVGYARWRRRWAIQTKDVFGKRVGKVVYVKTRTEAKAEKKRQWDKILS